ncbi:hypothetical protein M422DRAFT_252284, partial [Sphaerobolus stellatus SS14]
MLSSSATNGKTREVDVNGRLREGLMPSDSLQLDEAETAETTEDFTASSCSMNANLPVCHDEMEDLVQGLRTEGAVLWMGPRCSTSVNGCVEEDDMRGLVEGFRELNKSSNEEASALESRATMENDEDEQPRLAEIQSLQLPKPCNVDFFQAPTNILSLPMELIAIIFRLLCDPLPVESSDDAAHPSTT